MKLDYHKLLSLFAFKFNLRRYTKGKELKERPAIRNRIIGISPKEFKMLEYVNNFRAQFVELYPKRRPLMLDPPNECGVRKFICTTVGRAS